MVLTVHFWNQRIAYIVTHWNDNTYVPSHFYDKGTLVLHCIALSESRNQRSGGYCDCSRFAHKLRTAGKLLDFVCIPGAKHGSGMMPQFRWGWQFCQISNCFRQSNLEVGAWSLEGGNPGVPCEELRWLSRRNKTLNWSLTYIPPKDW